MEFLYLDTSALVKIYINEPGTERMKELASPNAGNRLAVCSITQVEFHAAIWRRHRIRELDDEEVELAIELFNVRHETEFVRHSIDDRMLNFASELTSRHPLRGYDAVQLAACLSLARIMPDPPTFVCADGTLLTAVVAEGLPVLDPSASEPPVLDPAEVEEPPVSDTEGD